MWIRYKNLDKDFMINSDKFYMISKNSLNYIILKINDDERAELYFDDEKQRDTAYSKITEGLDGGYNLVDLYIKEERC